jgi:hypothetical protein
LPKPYLYLLDKNGVVEFCRFFVKGFEIVFEVVQKLHQKIGSSSVDDVLPKKKANKPPSNCSPVNPFGYLVSDFYPIVGDVLVQQFNYLVFRLAFDNKVAVLINPIAQFCSAVVGFPNSYLFGKLHDNK